MPVPSVHVSPHKAASRSSPIQIYEFSQPFPGHVDASMAADWLEELPFANVLMRPSSRMITIKQHAVLSPWIASLETPKKAVTAKYLRLDIQLPSNVVSSGVENSAPNSVLGPSLYAGYLPGHGTRRWPPRPRSTVFQAKVLVYFRHGQNRYVLNDMWVSSSTEFCL
jgi:hypothetical protein